MGGKKCDFCNKTVLKKQLVYKDKLASIIYPQRPIVFSHLMIIPNRHVERFEDLTSEEIINMSQLVKKSFRIFKSEEKACGFNLFTNDGTKAGQKIPHIHWHIFFRFEQEPVSPFQVLNDPKLREKNSTKEWKQGRDNIVKLLKLKEES